MGGSSLHVPAITGVGLAVCEGWIVSVGMAVLITGVIVSVAERVGGTIFWELPQELWIRKNTNGIRKLNIRFK
jgi:hypothetical protein